MTTDLLIGSASAKWAILSPVLVPMLMLIGISPEATQAAYRLGDSTTNMITPFMAYFPLILIVAQRYRPDFGIGSMMALEAIKLIAQAGEPLVGRVMLFDGLKGEARTVALKRDPNCPVCGHE